MGRVSVEFEVANYGDLTLAKRGLLPGDQVRREIIHDIVDSGATKLVLPEAVVKRLGLTAGSGVKVRYTDGRQVKRRERGGCLPSAPRPPWHLHRRRRTQTNNRVVGAIVLEDLDLLVDCAAQKLVPRDPKGETFEIE